MTFKKNGSRIIFNVSTNGTENQKGICRRGAFLSLTNRIVRKNHELDGTEIPVYCCCRRCYHDSLDSGNLISYAHREIALRNLPCCICGFR